MKSTTGGWRQDTEHVGIKYKNTQHNDFDHNNKKLQYSA